LKMRCNVIHSAEAKINTGIFAATLYYLAGEGHLAAFDKQTLRRLIHFWAKAAFIIVAQQLYLPRVETGNSDEKTCR